MGASVKIRLPPRQQRLVHHSGAQGDRRRGGAGIDVAGIAGVAGSGVAGASCLVLACVTVLPQPKKK